MPRLETREISIALDMHGCPNRCRHCWLGCASQRHMSEEDLRWASAQFRSYVKPGEDRPFIEEFAAYSWFREPDYSDDYERLYDLEDELSDGHPGRFELLSIWRLARDPAYPGWAKKVGPDTCQITFFGMEETTDWFCRRRGAFRDCITATERLLDAGMKPRWQFFLTKKILPDLGDLMRLIDRMKIRERVQALGGEFVVFIHTPDMDGEGRKIAHLSADIDDVKLIPEELVASTAKHFGPGELRTTEAETVSKLRSGEIASSPVHGIPDHWFFFITPDWDVFSNMGTLDPWWKLGNLKTDSVAAIFHNLENDLPLGYQANSRTLSRELAERFGGPNSQRILLGPDGRWLADYCEEVFHKPIK